MSKKLINSINEYNLKISGIELFISSLKMKNYYCMLVGISEAIRL